MQLVLLAFQVTKESANAHELALAVEHGVAMLFIKVDPCHIERNACLFGVPLQIREQRAILRLGPRLNRAIGKGLQLVRDYKVQIEVDGIAKSLALRTRTVGIIEGEEPWLGLFVFQMAVLALKPLGEAKHG